MATEKEVTDHFGAWVTLVGAGIALGASLATALLASFLENRRDAARRKHANEVEETKRRYEAGIRFHDERLVAYVDFVSAVLHLASAATVCAANNDDLRPFSSFMDAGLDLKPYLMAMARVRMLAKAPLIEYAQKVHNLVQQLTTERLGAGDGR
jgi:hypothetical protein